MTDTTTRRRRPVTAAVAAKRLGISKRTVYRYVAEYRNWYEARAAERRAKAFHLRHLGNSWAEVGKAMQISGDAARKLASRFEQAPSAPSGDPNTVDMFARTGT